MSNVLAAKVLTVLGFFLGPLFPIIGQFLVDKAKSWVAWVLIAITILWIAVPTSTAQKDGTASTSSAIVLFLAYFAILIYATIHVFRDF